MCDASERDLVRPVWITSTLKFVFLLGANRQVLDLGLQKLPVRIVESLRWEEGVSNSRRTCTITSRAVRPVSCQRLLGRLWRTVESTSPHGRLEANGGAG